MLTPENVVAEIEVIVVGGGFAVLEEVEGVEGGFAGQEES